MDYVVVWFILSGGTGYIPFLEVRDAAQCGRPGVIVGVQVDRQVNPTAVLWPDPQVVGQHCRTDISQRVAGLQPGNYHIATTIMGNGTRVPYIGHDPHTSPPWSRLAGSGEFTSPAPPDRPRIKGVESQP